MRWPSVAGVLEAWVFWACLCGRFFSWIVDSQSFAPVERLMQRTNCRSACSSALVRTTLLPTRIGVECPRPGIAVFQMTLSVSLQEIGASASGLWLSDFGPRHQGQSSEATLIGGRSGSGFAAMSLSPGRECK